eukprot:g63527.t1
MGASASAEPTDATLSPETKLNDRALHVFEELKGQAGLVSECHDFISDHPAFISAFYKTLFRECPDILKARMFNTSQKKIHALKGVMNSLELMITYPQKVDSHCSPLVASHVRLGVTRQMFQTYGPVLNKCLKSAMGEKFTRAHENLFQKVYKVLSEAMSHGVERDDAEDELQDGDEEGAKSGDPRYQLLAHWSTKLNNRDHEIVRNLHREHQRNALQLQLSQNLMLFNQQTITLEKEFLMMKTDLLREDNDEIESLETQQQREREAAKRIIQAKHASMEQEKQAFLATERAKQLEEVIAKKTDQQRLFQKMLRNSDVQKSNTDLLYKQNVEQLAEQSRTLLQNSRELVATVSRRLDNAEKLRLSREVALFEQQCQLISHQERTQLNEKHLLRLKYEDMAAKLLLETIEKVQAEEIKHLEQRHKVETRQILQLKDQEISGDISLLQLKQRRADELAKIEQNSMRIMQEKSRRKVATMFEKDMARRLKTFREAQELQWAEFNKEINFLDFWNPDGVAPRSGGTGSKDEDGSDTMSLGSGSQYSFKQSQSGESGVATLSSLHSLGLGLNKSSQGALQEAWAKSNGGDRLSGGLGGIDFTAIKLAERYAKDNKWNEELAADTERRRQTNAEDYQQEVNNLRDAKQRLEKLHLEEMNQMAERDRARLEEMLSQYQDQLRTLQFSKESETRALLQMHIKQRKLLRTHLQEEFRSFRRGEELQVKLHDSAVQGSRMKGDFLAFVCHELRHPLHGIVCVLENLKEDGNIESATKELSIQTDMMRIILNDVLDLSKIEAGKLKLVYANLNLPATLEQLGKEAAANIKASQKNVELVLRIGDGVPKIGTTEPLRLRQCLLNLLSNALKFTSKGTITLQAELEPGMELPPNSPPGTVMLRLSVIDTGIGIAPEHLQHIFAKFQQAEANTSHRFGGTGLGLNISRKLMKLMEGDLQVSSEVGKGSVFSLLLPFRPPMTDSESEVALLGSSVSSPAMSSVSGAFISPNTRQRNLGASAASPNVDVINYALTGGSKRAVRVLCADDNNITRRVNGKRLGKLGWKVDHATDGDVAVSMALEKHEAGQDYDLILLDGFMPSKNGDEACFEMQKKGIPSLIIAATGQGMQEDRDKFLKSGMHEVLVKPFVVSDMLRTIWQAMDRRTPGSTEEVLKKLQQVNGDGKANGLPNGDSNGDSAVTAKSAAADDQAKKPLQKALKQSASRKIPSNVKRLKERAPLKSFSEANGEGKGEAEKSETDANQASPSSSSSRKGILKGKYLLQSNLQSNTPGRPYNSVRDSNAPLPHKPSARVRQRSRVSFDPADVTLNSSSNDVTTTTTTTTTTSTTTTSTTINMITSPSKATESSPAASPSLSSTAPHGNGIPSLPSITDSSASMTACLSPTSDTESNLSDAMMGGSARRLADGETLTSFRDPNITDSERLINAKKPREIYVGSPVMGEGHRKIGDTIVTDETPDLTLLHLKTSASRDISAQSELSDTDLPKLEDDRTPR